MEIVPADATYAEQITDIYKRVKSEHGEELASKFSDFMRGASLIEGGDLVPKYIESLNKDDFDHYFRQALNFGNDIRRYFSVDSTREAFVLLKERNMAKDYRSYWISGTKSDAVDRKAEEKIDVAKNEVAVEEEQPYDERLYAERVTEIFKRVESLIDTDKAKKFNEFVRGASLLVESDNYAVANKVDKLSDVELNKTVDKLIAVGDKLMKQYETDTVYEAFERVSELGRTKMYIWDGDEYKEVIVEEEEKSIVPWTGVIRIGGPNQILNGGAFSVLGPLSIKSDGKSITINGHVFEKTRENDPNIRYVETAVPKIEDEIRDDRRWDGKWELAVDDSGNPLKGGPEGKMYMRRVSD